MVSVSLQPIRSGWKLAMSMHTKWAISFLVLILTGSCLLYPAILSRSIDWVQAILTEARQDIVACIPLILYIVVGFVTRDDLWKVPPDVLQMEVDKQQAASLTLAGFCFTSLSLLIAFFKTAIEQRDPAP